MAITATMVRELREMTGAAMMDCKKALEASDGDIEHAIDQLRKQGLKSAAKKAGRETAEGRVIAISAEGGRRGHLVGLACETDFLAASDPFKEFVNELEEHVALCDPTGLEGGERPFEGQPWKNEGPSAAERIKAAVGQFRENVRVTELVRMENAGGFVGFYVHHDKKSGAIVSVTTQGDGARAEDVLRSLCQHIVVFNPTYRTKTDVPADDLDRERAVLRESDEVKSKPENIRDKIVEGKLGKFYAGTVLEEQPWIHEDKLSVKKALEKELGAGTAIESYARIRLGG
jgi:elongation factor Ts